LFFFIHQNFEATGPIALRRCFLRRTDLLDCFDSGRTVFMGPDPGGS
jgi:hypothetical protein